jgi:hypothetical protein
MLLMLLKLLLLMLLAAINRCMDAAAAAIEVSWRIRPICTEIRSTVYGLRRRLSRCLQTLDREHIMTHENHCHDSKFYFKYVSKQY